MVKKILTINTVFSQGGAAKIARTLHDVLNKTPGFSSRFAYGRGKKIKSKEVFSFGVRSEAYLRAFLTRLMGLQGCGSWFSTKRLEGFILKEKFDLIHLHNLHGYYLDLSFVRFLNKLNIPIVWTLHDAWPITGRCSYFLDCNRWKTGCGSCPSLSMYPKTYLDSSALMWKKKKECFTKGWSPVVVCPSWWLADRVKESYLNKYRVEVIPNGVDTGIFKPKDRVKIQERLKISPSKKIILFVAADLREERKGTEYFFEALKYVKTKDCLVLTVGKKINLNQKTKENIEIKQLGYMSDNNLISDIYNTSDIFCTTSLQDNFPTTILEAMACGIPIIGFKTGGIPEQVSEDCGILIESRNVEELAEGIDELLSNNEKRNKFSLNCRRRVLENYSIEKFKEQYINLYKNLLK
ncbi:MAG: glycosyltransferase [Candidatus Nealsonbacteria bacterium]|nr:MAG: glycosyltransferase [Candidatus Nealsonbacteria bacterium]